MALGIFDDDITDGPSVGLLPIGTLDAGRRMAVGVLSTYGAG